MARLVGRGLEVDIARGLSRDVARGAKLHVTNIGRLAGGPQIAFKGFLRELRRFAGVSTKALEDAEKLLKSVDSGIKSVDDAISSAPITRTKDGIILIGDETVGSVDRIMRSGDLENVIRISKRTDIPITSADREAFKVVVGDTPEKAMKEVDDMATRNKRTYPDLDAGIDDIDNISESGKKNLKKIESNLFKYFKRGTVITLTIGVVYVTVDWLAKATNARRGCFMLTTINGETTSCKVQEYTCSEYQDGDHCKSVSRDYYNVTLVLMHVAKLEDTDARKIAVAEAAGVPVDKLNDQLGKVIDNSYEKVALAINSMTDRPTVNVCGLSHADVEGGKIPPCRMCSPTANPLSTSFIDPDQYAENVTFQCVINPNLMDTITDVISKTGKNILDGVGSFVSGSLKSVGIIAIVVLVLLIILFVIIKILPTKSTASANTDTNINRSAAPSSFQQQPRPLPQYQFQHYYPM